MRLTQITLAILFVGLASKIAVSQEQQLIPEYQVWVYVSDGSFPCPPCERFKKQVLPIWEKQGWPIGVSKEKYIRIIPCVTGPVPYFEVRRKGVKIASHTGFLSPAQFRAFVKKHIPGWFEAAKSPVQKPVTPTQEAPRYWQYKKQLLLGE